MIGLIGLGLLALIIGVAALAILDARRWQAGRPAEAPLDMGARAAGRAQPTGLTIIVRGIAARKGGDHGSDLTRDRE